MFKRHFLLKLILIILVVVVGVYIAAYAASGDTGDPLVSLSYIENIFKPEIMDSVGNLVDTAKSELTDSIDSTLDEFKTAMNSDTVNNALDQFGNEGYETTKLSDGQTVELQAGCEFLFVSGDGLCLGDVSDTTTGSSMTDGRLEANHLYLCPGAASIVADGEAQVLIKGDYNVNQE